MKPHEAFKNEKTFMDSIDSVLKRVEECKESGHHKRPVYFAYQPIREGENKGKYRNDGICGYCGVPVSRIIDDLPEEIKNLRIGKSLQL